MVCFTFYKKGFRGRHIPGPRLGLRLMPEMFKARIGGEGDGLLPADAVPLMEVPPRQAVGFAAREIG